MRRASVARHQPLERCETAVIRVDRVARRIAALQEELAAALAEGDREVASWARVEARGAHGAEGWRWRDGAASTARARGEPVDATKGA